MASRFATPNYYALFSPGPVLNLESKVDHIPGIGDYRKSRIQIEMKSAGRGRHRYVPTISEFIQYLANHCDTLENIQNTLKRLAKNQRANKTITRLQKRTGEEKKVTIAQESERYVESLVKLLRFVHTNRENDEYEGFDDIDWPADGTYIPGDRMNQWDQEVEEDEED